MSVHLKEYANRHRAAEAVAHLRWLTTLDAGVRLPTMEFHAGTRVGLEHLTGRTIAPDDLPAVADALGRLHAAAHRHALHLATISQPYRAGNMLITDFVSPRRRALQRQPVPYQGLPTALYKDANVRNFLITTDGVALIDFDDLTLAPFGYDLAKLIVTTAMTFGEPGNIPNTLAAYNARISPNACPASHLRCYAELHHDLTVGYLGRNGYRHRWTDLRPWPGPPRPGPLPATTR